MGPGKELYCVSPFFAEGKGPDVEEGCYVEAGDPGEPFEIRITKVHKGEEHIKGERWAEMNKGASAKLPNP